MTFVGLDSADRHLERVRRRVSHGGHDIPEPTIRQRYDRSRLNLIRLLPQLTELKVYDNTIEADPEAGITPEPVLILQCAKGKVLGPAELSGTPDWAKPIVAAAIRR